MYNPNSTYHSAATGKQIFPVAYPDAYDPKDVVETPGEAVVAPVEEVAVEESVDDEAAKPKKKK